MQDLKKFSLIYLATVATVERQCNSTSYYAGIHDLVSRQGKVFSNFISSDKIKNLQYFSEPKQCYYNAWQTLQINPKENFIYCEGYMFIPNIPIGIIHGWLVDKNKNVFDPTIKNYQSNIYIGLTFDPNYVRQVYLNRAIKNNQRSSELNVPKRNRCHKDRVINYGILENNYLDLECIYHRPFINFKV